MILNKWVCEFVGIHISVVITTQKKEKIIIINILN